MLNLQYKDNIILIGFPSCGKTTLGQKLAEQLNYQFIDTDALIGTNCRSLYQKEGKQSFRLKEKEAISTLRNHHHHVIAAGGGSIYLQENVALFKQIGLVIYLCVDKNILKNRILQNGIPAFLDAEHFETSFETMHQERELLYQNAADMILVSY